MDVHALSVIVFLTILGFLVYKDRKNIEFKYFLLLRRTKFGIKLLDKMSKPKKIWKIFATIGIAIAFFLMFEGFYSLIAYGKLLIEGVAKLPGLSFVIPSIKSEVEVGKGYLLLPFWFWVIIVISVIVPHEGLHGIMCRTENVKVKSAGFLLLLILPGAFVEPDEKQLRKAKLISKLRIFVAGSVANFLVYLFVYALTSYIIWPYLVPGPIELKEVNATGPAAQAGLKPGMYVTEINGKPVKLTYTEFLSGSRYLAEETANLKPGDEITIKANNTEFKLKLASNPENASLPYMGIVYSPVTRGNTNMNFLLQLLTWMWIINYAVAIFNILPLYPLDGGMVVRAIAEKISKKNADGITYFISFLTISILLFNFVFPLLSQVTLQPS
ncbi:MAG: site-2 protease family protein [Candidatus Aenigmatarchaeota archaeon]